MVVSLAGSALAFGITFLFISGFKQLENMDGSGAAPKVFQPSVADTAGPALGKANSIKGRKDMTVVLVRTKSSTDPGGADSGTLPYGGLFLDN